MIIYIILFDVFPTFLKIGNTRPKGNEAKNKVNKKIKTNNRILFKETLSIKLHKCNRIRR